MKNEYFTGLSWYSDFDLNMICLSVISSCFAFGSYFVDTSNGGKSWFIYFLLTLCLSLLIYKFLISMIASYLDKTGNNIIAEKDWSRLTMFLLGLTAFLWTSSWLYAFAAFNLLMLFQTLLVGFFCVMSILAMLSSNRKE